MSPYFKFYIKEKNGGEYHPNGNVTAKTFRFTSPAGETFDIFNGASKFAESKGISLKIIKKT